MYQEHFGLSQEPFSIAPDPKFLFLSDAHNEALAHLMYGFSHGGFVLITGEVGTGKTTLLRNLLDRTPPELDVAFILNPRLTVKELLETLCDELGVVYDPATTQTVKQYIDCLNKHLLATHQAGRSTVVIIDEAQNLSPAVLEQIRLLTNLETNDKKLIRMILLGQPELAEMLDRTELRQLAQRITARYHLTPLKKDDVAAYVTHRLARAGGNPAIFTKSAVAALYRKSKGTPRLINVIADRAMLGAYVEGEYQVTPALIQAAAHEVLGRSRFNVQWLTAGGLVAAILAVMLWAWFAFDDEPADTRLAADGVTSTPAQVRRSAQRAQPSDEPTQPADTSPRSARLSVDLSANQGEPIVTTNQTPTETAAQTTQPVYAPVAIERPSGRLSRVQRAAYRAVFAQWGADYPADSQQIPCDFAPRVQLQCLSRKGGWSEISQLNRPVVLELWDDQPSPYYAALIRSDGQRYTLVLDDEELDISPRDLRDNWFGAYVILWQTPPRYMGSLREGDNHPTVAWLHEKLTEIDPDNQLGDPISQFTPTLRDAVVEFQQFEGLMADGIVGPLTWIRLSDRLNLPAPKLLAASSSLPTG